MLQTLNVLNDSVELHVLCSCVLHYVFRSIMGIQYVKLKKKNKMQGKKKNVI